MGDLKLNGATSGTITLTPTAVAGTNTITLPANTGTAITTGSTSVVSQAMLAGNVAGNGPAFSAYQTGTAQVLPVSTYTKINLNAEEFDTNSNFDSTTNYRFTPTVAGYYQINATVHPASATTIICVIYKNGAAYKFGSGTTTYGNLVSLAALVYCNGSTDYVELYAFSTVTATMTTGITGCTMQGFLARSA